MPRTVVEKDLTMDTLLHSTLLQAHAAEIAADAWSAFETYFHARRKLREDPEVAVRAQLEKYGVTWRAAERAVSFARKARGDDAVTARAAANAARAAADAQKAILLAAMEEAQPASRMKVQAAVIAADRRLPLAMRDSLVKLADKLLDAHGL